MHADWSVPVRQAASGGLRSREVEPSPALEPPDAVPPSVAGVPDAPPEPAPPDGAPPDDVAASDDAVVTVDSLPQEIKHVAQTAQIAKRSKRSTVRC